MRKSLLLFALLPVLILFLHACSKPTGFDDLPGHRYDPVFSSYSEAGTTLTELFTRAGQGEQLLQVENIVFLESGNKAYALVFYQSSLGHRNIMFVHTYQGETIASSTTYQCLGNNCDCKVVTDIGPQGEVHIDCSCTSCTMLQNSF